MADIDDAEVELDQMIGVENHWTGRVLRFLVRAVRFTHARTGLLANRLNDVEARLTALENPPPE